MASVIISNMTDEKRLSQLKEFLKQKAKKAKIVEEPYRCVKCDDLKTAIEVSRFVQNLRHGGNK